MWLVWPVAPQNLSLRVPPVMLGTLTGQQIGDNGAWSDFFPEPGSYTWPANTESKAEFLQPHIGVVHLRTPSNLFSVATSTLTIWLGTRWRVVLGTGGGEVPGIDLIAGHRIGGSWPTLRVYDGDEAIYDEPVHVASSPFDVQAGFVYELDLGWQLYVHLHGNDQNHFGGGTLSLRFSLTTDEAALESDMFSDRAAITIRNDSAAEMILSIVAAKVGPMAKLDHNRPEEEAARRARRHTMIGSLMSRARRGLRIVPKTGQANTYPAAVDLAGHPECGLAFFPLENFLLSSLPGDIDHETAFTDAVEAGWKSNLFPNDADNQLFARLRVASTQSLIDAAGAEWAFDRECSSNGIGNNEYINYQGSAVGNINVFAHLELTEHLANDAETYDEVEYENRYFVQVTAIRVTGPNATDSRFRSRVQLTDEQVEDLLAGLPVELAVDPGAGNILIQAVG